MTVRGGFRSPLLTAAAVPPGTITSVMIDSLTVSKLTGGTIAAQEIVLSNSPSSVLRSDNFVTGPGGAGWQILGDGVAEFNQVTVRGTIYATAGELGTLDIIGTLTMGVGGLFRTAPTGQRIEMSDTVSEEIRFYSGAVGETQPGKILTSAGGTLSIYGPQDGGLDWSRIDFALAGELVLNSADVRILGDSLRIGDGSGDATISRYNLVAANLVIENAGGAIVFSPAGTAALPGLVFAGDTNTGWYPGASGHWIYSSEGTDSIDIWGSSGQGVLDFRGVSHGYLRNQDGGRLYLANDVANQPIFITTNNGAGGKNRIYIDGGIDLIAFYTHDGVNDFQFHNGNLELLQNGKIVFDGLSGGNDWIGGPVNGQIEMRIESVQEFLLGTTGFQVPNVYASTTANAANVYVSADGRMWRSTSSKRYKRDVRPWRGGGVLDLDVVTYAGMAGNLRPKVKGRGVREKLTRTGLTHIGFIAEQVADVFPLAAILDADGRPDAIDWNAITAALVGEVRELRDRLDAAVSPLGRL